MEFDTYFMDCVCDGKQRFVIGFLSLPVPVLPESRVDTMASPT